MQMKARKSVDAAPIPTESMEQQCLFRWAAMQSAAWPELGLMYHIPNGGHRSKSQAGRFKAEGVKAGVPDICLPVARYPWHGLYIELKRRTGGRKSEEQKMWLALLDEQGFKAICCQGWEAAAIEITRYLHEFRKWG